VPADTTAPHRAERAALCDLCSRVGPDAPTLCQGWQTLDLVTHLVVRENDPIAASGLVLGGPFARALERAMARTKHSGPYDRLVARVRGGPPAWLRPVDGLMNLTEFFVHHEDVRRGAGDFVPRPEAEVADVEDALWRSMRHGAGMMTRVLKGIGLDLVRPDGAVIHARKGSPVATIAGRPGEIALYLSGRARAAHVEVGGDAAARARVQEAKLGI
jgi:uncharacterized protein (TIGR03085 family)